MPFLPWCRASLITRSDGVKIAVTDWDNSFILNGDIYQPTNGISPTAIKQNQNTTPNNFDLISIVSETITEQDLLLGRYENATLELFIYNWMSGTKVRTIFLGYLGQLQINYNRSGAQEFSIQAQSLDYKLQQKATLLTTRLCRHSFGSVGDGKCNKNLSSLTSIYTVSSVIDNYTYQVGVVGQATDFFKTGKLTFNTGLLAGLSADIASSSSNSFTIQLGFAFPPAIGDEFQVYPGCKKTLDACKAYNNILNFGGFPFLPGVSLMLGGASNLI